MDRSILMAMVLGLLVLLLVLMVLGWRARKRRQQSVSPPAQVPGDLGEPAHRFDGKYVATTASGDPYDRIAVHGLGFRGQAVVLVFDTGLVLQRAGSDDIWIADTQLRDIRRATWTIDRVVEPGGLHLIEWTLGDRTVDSYLRLTEPGAFDAATRGLVPTERQAS